MIARPFRRTGPIPFAPFPPLAERPLMAAPRESRDIRETRLRSRWLPVQQAQSVMIQASRHGGAELPPSAAPGLASVPLTPRGACHAVYHGQGTLSVLSSITGHHYRFEGRGSTLTIDPRDRLVLGRLSELSIHTASA